MLELMERNSRVVDAYRAGQNLRQIGDVEGVSQETVRQILLCHTDRTGERLIRRQGGPCGPRHTVTWKCGQCGEERLIAPHRAKTKICRKCHCENMGISVDKIEGWIAARKQGTAWTVLARAAGRKTNQSAMLARSVWLYLRRTDRLNEAAEVWPNGVPPQLTRMFPPK